MELNIKTLNRSLNRLMIRLNLIKRFFYIRTPLSKLKRHVKNCFGILYSDKLDIPLIHLADTFVCDFLVKTLVVAGEKNNFTFTDLKTFTATEVCNHFAIPKNRVDALEMAFRLLSEKKYLKIEDNRYSFEPKFLNSFTNKDVPADYLKKLNEEFPFMHSQIARLSVGAENFYELLTSEREPIEIEHPQGSWKSVSDFFLTSSITDAYASGVSTYFKELTRNISSGKVYKILHLYGGSAQSALLILHALRRLNVEYYFTDPSESAINTAKKQLSSFSNIKFIKLDPHGDTLFSQFQDQQFDAILSTGPLVVHGKSYDNLRVLSRLLLPKGTLLLREFSELPLFLRYMFFVTSSWSDTSSERRRVAVASPKEISSTLKENGFHGVEHVVLGTKMFIINFVSASRNK